ncbi:hypothetical protein MMC25_000148 [Agyrium rufum]|nr:hypothetical protein [Agyrium rufum]
MDSDMNIRDMRSGRENLRRFEFQDLIVSANIRKVEAALVNRPWTKTMATTGGSLDAVPRLSYSKEAPTPVDKEDPPSEDEHPADFKRSFRFWCIIIGFGITNLLGALENTVVSTAAPVILTDLQLGEKLIWITNTFPVCSAAVQPLFGRRWVTMAIVAIFTLGSGICGGATSGAMLIAGRAV